MKKKLTDKFLAAMGIGDDYDDEFDDEETYNDDEFDDYDNDNEEDEVKDKFFKKKAKEKEPLKEFIDDDFEDEDYEEEKANKFFGSKNNSKSSTKVVAMNKSTSKNFEITVIKPTNTETCKEIADILGEGRAVIINFEGIPIDIAQQILNFVSGSCYSMGGNLLSISNFIKIATPENVDISGDLMEVIPNESSQFM